MSEKKWFLMKAGYIQGPFERAQIEMEAQKDASVSVWGKGLNEWLPSAEWRDEVNRLQNQAGVFRRQLLWKMKYQDQVTGPFDYNQLLEELKKNGDYNRVQVWSEDTQGWKNVYSLPTIADELGISRREHPRVPLMGTLTVELPPATPTKFRAVTVSPGGLGLAEAKTLIMGQSYKGSLSSPHLSAQIHFVFEVVYAGPDGDRGLHFTSLPAEAEALILEYINKFGDLQPN